MTLTTSQFEKIKETITRWQGEREIYANRLLAAEYGSDEYKETERVLHDLRAKLVGANQIYSMLLAEF